MSLTYEEFATQAQSFAIISNAIGDTWQWHPPLQELLQQGQLYGYLSKSNVIRAAPPDSTTNTKEGDDAKQKCELLSSTDPSELCCDNAPWTTYEYHVAFHTSYRVPVLYFKAQHSDGGALLSPDEIWEAIPLHMRSDATRDTFISQADHPVLALPFYHVHPCQTPQLMQRLTAMREGTQQQYLFQWLSVVGPAVGLHLPLRLFVAAQQQASQIRLETCARPTTL